MVERMEGGGAAGPEEGHGRELRCGFVAVVGAPNTGKSTLVNRLVGAKVSIVSPKVQTTRSKVLGIFVDKESQVILVDTPGVFAPRRRLDRAMVSAAWSGAAGADEILLLVDSAKGYDDDTRRIVEQLRSWERRAILVLNKVDLVSKPSLLALAETLSREQVFTDTFMISAETGDGVGRLTAFLVGRLPRGPWLFPEDQLSDMPNRILSAEITRETLYLQLRNELPYASAVRTESWTENDDGSIRIDQVIYVERPSQKAIVVGKGGRQIKAIGQRSRAQLEKIFECRIHLFLFVKIREKWGDDPESYQDLGLDFNS
jgi:GTP-binding protein Era